METSDWIAIYSMVASVLIATIGSALYLSYRIGGSNEKIVSMAVSIDKLEDTMERNTKELREDVAALKADVGEVRVEMAEMRVKVDELWRDHVDGRRQKMVST
jgi:hypothetical protein